MPGARLRLYERANSLGYRLRFLARLGVGLAAQDAHVHGLQAPGDRQTEEREEQGKAVTQAHVASQSNFFSYTLEVTALARLWRTLRNLGLLGRFLTGKASFVEADIRTTTRGLSEVLESTGERRGPELLSHFQLSTKPPRTGSIGWELYLERVAAPSPHRAMRLECGYCGHVFIVQVLAAVTPPASLETEKQAPGRPASFNAEWFSFMHEDFQGDPSLNCPHCEQRGVPAVKRLL